MAAPGRDFSWSERSLYLCSCGLSYPAQRWRWIDRDARPEVAERAETNGPVEGFCPSCGKSATGMSAWLDLSPSKKEARLVMGPHARGDAVALLREHLEQLERRGDEVPAWMLQPAPRFIEGPAAPPAAAVVIEDAGVPRQVGASRFPASSSPSSDAPESRCHIGTVSIDDGVVIVSAELDAEARKLWGTAALRGRPVHLRDFGYPLIGVRLAASHIGQMSLLDGLADVAQEVASEVFVALSQDFRLELELRSEGSSSAVRREVKMEGLERNAALCLESARAGLATGDFPPGAYEQALARLAAADMDERIRPADSSLGVGDYRFLLSPRETWAALDHLATVSQKENLARLLEVDGFSVEEYEGIRKRVLKASVEHGLCAPRRFWRRVIASGLAESAADYAERLSNNRAALVEEGDDLDAEQQAEAWETIHKMCRRKGIPVPDALREALDLPEEATPLKARGNPAMSTAGEIGASKRPSNGVTADQLRQRLLQPEQRLAAAVEGLSARSGLDIILPALESFEVDELLELLPSLAEVGSAAVPGLTKLLRSQSPRLRQACAVLLAAAGDESALGPLCDALYTDETDAWRETARAIGSFGKAALPHLCSGVRDTTTLPEQEWMTRLARAMAEVAVASDGPDALREVEASSDESIAYSASHALATLEDVRFEGAQARGEEPLIEENSMITFARRAHEALHVPELELIEESAADVLEEGDLEFI